MTAKAIKASMIVMRSIWVCVFCNLNEEYIWCAFCIGICLFVCVLLDNIPRPLESLIIALLAPDSYFLPALSFSFPLLAVSFVVVGEMLRISWRGYLGTVHRSWDVGICGSPC